MMAGRTGVVIDFIMMGGYAAYVWSAFGFAAIVLAALLWQSHRFARKQAGILEGLRNEMPRPRGRRRTPVVTRHDQPRPSQAAEAPATHDLKPS